MSAREQDLLRRLSAMHRRAQRAESAVNAYRVLLEEEPKPHRRWARYLDVIRAHHSMGHPYLPWIRTAVRLPAEGERVVGCYGESVRVVLLHDGDWYLSDGRLDAGLDGVSRVPDWWTPIPPTDRLS